MQFKNIVRLLVYSYIHITVLVFLVKTHLKVLHYFELWLNDIQIEIKIDQTES